jgi:TorA maturation chaperone TorD
MPDHISIELEFMAALAGQEARAFGDEDFAEASRRIGLQKKFLTKHLGKWAPAFCREVAERSQLPFYREIARLSTAFLKAERQEMFVRLGAVAALRNGA